MASVMWAYQIFCLQLFLLFSQSSATLCSQDQSSALLQLTQLFSFMNHSSFYCDYYAKYSYFDEIDSPPYCDGRCASNPKTLSWKEDIDCCLWNGVTCDTVTGHVIGLDLSCGWLQGYIPSNSTLFLLHHLQRLNLAFNDFNLSQISSYFSRFPGLTHLNLSSANFRGQIPSEISHLSNLVSLDLSTSNSIMFWNNLRLERSVFDGLIQNLTKLTELSLDYVNMSTIIPSSFTNLSSSLTLLSLKACGLKGNFPYKIFQLPNLKILSLARNFNLTSSLPKVNWSGPLMFFDVSHMSLSGELFYSIGNLISLKHLGLSTCTIVGSVPTSLSNLTQLTFLDLSYNSFVGPIPSFLSNFNQLYHLDLDYNNFIGEFPVVFVNLTQLSFLSLSSNQLAGSIPFGVSGLPNLVYMSLFNNSFNGSLPSWLFNLPILESVDLGYNQFTSLEDEFKSNSIKYLYLDNNRLHGSVPSSIFELENLTCLFLSSNNFTGVELHMFSKLKTLEILDLSHISLIVSTTYKVNSSFHQLRWLHLSACNLSKFPDILMRADQLEELDLSNNKIYGQVPKWVGHIGKDTLYWLNLSYNYLISIEQHQWKYLDYLDLHSNLIQGPLPILSSSLYLRLLSLSNNKLIGEIPQMICNFSAIEILDLSNNSLSGTIPKCIGNFSSLHVLDLRKNRFYGTVPGPFANGNHLRTLNLNDNGLEGPLPRSLVNCTMLEVLDLGNNKINDSFPYWLENLPKLQVLVLCSNNFYGMVQDSSAHGTFPMLRIFDLSNNNFTGFLPRGYFENLKAMMNLDEARRKLNYMGETYYQDSVLIVVKGFETTLEKIITTFTTIDFSNNNFQGEIPESITNLHSLRLLNLSQNNLSGHIPISIGNLAALESLDLSSNKLVGEIPSQMTSLTFLAILNLSQNQLVGPIPRGNQFETFNNNSYSGNPRLCGFSLPNKCNVDEVLQPESSIFHDEDYNISSWFDWKVIMMGYACGLFLSLSIGYSVFSTEKPRWFLRMIDKAYRKRETGSRMGKTKQKWCS